MDRNGTRCNDYRKISVQYIVVGVLVFTKCPLTYWMVASIAKAPSPYELPESRKLNLEQASHFLRFMTLMHISSKPSFASPAGKALIAEIALSAYSCARARVCSNPSVCPTISRA
jgi:hypothetical protein